MKTTRLAASAATCALLVTSVLAAAGPADAATKAKTYKNCTALNRVYPHGVGKPTAHDHTSGTPVTSLKRSTPLYNANTKSDRDKDGIACEKH